jgi:superfamily II DNA or RNA helicase
MSETYKAFLAQKIVKANPSGREIPADDISPVLYDFQRDITKWAVRLGRAAVFADCGLGKTLIQIEWARHVGGRILIAAPLCVSAQTIREGVKLQETIHPIRHPDELEDGINITNYEMLSGFVGVPLDGIVLDESSILKSIDGRTRTLLLKEFTGIPWRLCCTATPCPNDIAELANHAEFLGVMSRVEMLSSFFVHDDEGWRLRGHATKPFHRWLASWSMSMKSPADLGYPVNGFNLPALNISDAIIETDYRTPGHLFPGGLKGITDRSNVRKATVESRVKVAADLAREAGGQVVIWCGLNKESALVASALGDDAVEVKGADSNASKEAAILSFLRGEKRILVTKPKIAGFGMNFQNASTAIFLGLGDSYESYYQCIRRSWRYGQKKPVNVHIVITDHEHEILDNVRRKESESENLSRQIIAAAREYEMEELKSGHREEFIESKLYEGESWKLMQGDSVDRINEISADSVDLSVFSPPFCSLYTYSPTERDLGNSSSREQFFEHFGYIIDGLMRVTKPGRIVCCHVQQIATTIQAHGSIGMYDFRGDTIRAFIDRDWPSAPTARRSCSSNFGKMRHGCGPASLTTSSSSANPERTPCQSCPTSRTTNGSNGRGLSGTASANRTHSTRRAPGQTKTTDTSARSSLRPSNDASDSGATRARRCSPRSPVSAARATSPSCRNGSSSASN